MATHSIVHLLLHPPHDELDELPTMESIHELFLEGFQWANDDVTVEFETIATENNDQQHYGILITCDNVWRVQIHFIEGSNVLREAQEWARLYANDLPIEDQARIRATFRRLNITTDPDVERDYFDFVLAMLEHLRSNFTPCHLYDAMHNIFME